MNRQVPAFTLLELLLVMVLSGIVYVCVYQIFGFVQNHYTRFQTNQEQLSTYSNLHHLMQEDFQRAKVVYSAEMGLSFHQTNGLVKYQFLSEGVMRQQGGVIDTFKVDHQRLQFFSKRERVYSRGQLIDEVYFTAGLNDEEIFYHFHKAYAMDVYLSDPLKEEFSGEVW